MLVVLVTTGSFPADTKVHHPMITGLLDEVGHDLGRQHHVDRFFNLSVDRNCLIFGEINNIIPFEKQLIYHSANHGKVSRLCQQKTPWEKAFDQIYEPNWT